jgi:DNA-directed RNA polymerase subunit RPC12/RpoP
MTPTSEERIKVAASMREARDSISFLPNTPVEQRAYDAYKIIIACVGYERGNIFDILADLIDPTCHIVLKPSDSDFKDEPHYLCSKCGKEGIDVYEIAGIVCHARYCSNCGARVVD